MNPLRDPQDRRLPRIPEPCALVIFGVTGDLARKKLLPAVYDLANRGLLPPGFVVLGFARRDWGDGDFETLACEAARKHARTPWRDEVWARLAGNIKFVGGSFDDDAAFDQLASTLDDLRQTHGITGNAAFYFSIPPAAFPVVLKQLARTGMADNEQVRRLASGRRGEAVRQRPALGEGAQRPRRRRVHPAGRLPDRPLPGQGDGSEHPRPAVRQQPVRAAVELQVRRLGADHHGGGRRHRHPRRLLRHRRHRPRRAAEPPSPTPRPGGDGGADQLRRRRDPGREAEGAQGHHPAQGRRPGHRPRSVPARLGRRRTRCRLPGGAGRPRRTPPPRRTWRCGWASRTAAGRRCRSTSGPASGCPGGSPRSPSCSRRRRTCRSTTPTWSRWATTSWSSGCSRTRAWCSSSARRCRVRRWRSATSRWTSSTARRSPSPAPRRTSVWCWTC